MSELTFEQKQDHYHKIRRSTTWPACAWKGSTPNRPIADKPLPTREAVLAKYRDTPR